ncbi:hypothetical protein FHG87_018548, partial [Trinorchestia longiramus]
EWRDRRPLLAGGETGTQHPTPHDHVSAFSASFPTQLLTIVSTSKREYCVSVGQQQRGGSMSSPSQSPPPRVPAHASPLSVVSGSPHSLGPADCGDDGGFCDDGRRRTAAGRGRREDTPPAPCSVLCGPRSCSTLPPSLVKSHDAVSPETPSKGRRSSRLWGLRGLVKMFRRKVRRRSAVDASSPSDGDHPTPSSSPPPPQPTTARARSASELLGDNGNRSGCGPYNQGISVSHDSVFSPDSPPDPPSHHAAPPALTLASRGVNMCELKAVLRRRVASGESSGGDGGRRGKGDDSGSGDDDPGLPRSPPPTSPTTLDVLNHGLKSVSRTTQSTCSDGSLLSMGSSELEEASTQFLFVFDIPSLIEKMLLQLSKCSR